MGINATGEIHVEISFLWIKRHTVGKESISMYILKKTSLAINGIILYYILR